MTQKSLIVVYLLVCFGQPTARSQPVPVGGQKQLLADDYIVADVHKVSRSLGKVAKANGGKPLSFTRLNREGRRVPIDVWPLFASVYYDAQKKRFRLWHRISFQGNPDRQLNDREIGVGVDYLRGYSESRDGLHFDFVSDLKGLTTSGDTNLAVTIDDHRVHDRRRALLSLDARRQQLVHRPRGHSTVSAIRVAIRFRRPASKPAPRMSGWCEHDESHPPVASTIRAASARC